MLDKIPFNHHKLKYFSLARNYRVVHFSPVNFKKTVCSVVGGVGLSPWGLENRNFLGLIGDWLSLELNEGLGSWP
jgi:hypothetical protein